MKLKLTEVNKEIVYDESRVFLNGVVCATYTSSAIIWKGTSKRIAELQTYSNHTWTSIKEFGCAILEAHDRNHTLCRLETGTILGHYTGSSAGAVASFVAYKYAEKFEPDKLKPAAASQEEPEKDSDKQLQKVIIIKEKEEEKEEPIIIPPPIQELRPPEPYKERRQEQKQTTPPVPQGGSEGGGPGCLAIILGALCLYAAVMCIPQSWKDLSTYIAAGDSGIILSFFGALIGSILAIIFAITKKPSFLTDCKTAFFTPCGIGILISWFILLRDIFAGDYELTGWIIFDIPLALFAPILGSFQFALPLGIFTLIACLIIKAIKSSD